MSAVWEWLNRPLTTVDLIAYSVGWWIGGRLYDRLIDRRVGRHEARR